MEREKLESLLIEYIDGTLSEAERTSVNDLLKADESVAQLYTELKTVMAALDETELIVPSHKLKLSFEKKLAEEAKSLQPKKIVFFQPTFYRIAAAVSFLVVGIAIGFWVNQYQHQQNELASIKREMEQTRNAVMAMLENQQSPSQRILGVKASYMSKKDDQILDALIERMTKDTNSNVRLAAIEALKKFQREPVVRKAFINALQEETDPVIQISLIQLLVEMKEKEALKKFENIIERNEVLPAVKDEAHAGIFKLS